MTKLVARSGKIMGESTFSSGPVNVVFRKAAISPQGDLGEVQLTMDDTVVRLTYAQAISFAHEIIRRCSK